MATMLVRANEDVFAQCLCAREAARLLIPGPSETPWDGSGWLFLCAGCSRGVCFARGAEVPGTYADVVRLRYGVEANVTAAQIAEYAALLERDCASLEVGRVYVTFDGLLIPADAGGIRGAGALGWHDLEGLPHVKALADPAVRATVLGSQAYWTTARMRRQAEGADAPEPPPMDPKAALTQCRPAMLGALVTAKKKDPVVVLIHRASGIVPTAYFDQICNRPWYTSVDERYQVIAWLEHFPSSRQYAKEWAKLKRPAPAGHTWAVIGGSSVLVTPFKLPE